MAWVCDGNSVPSIAVATRNCPGCDLPISRVTSTRSDCENFNRRIDRFSIARFGRRHGGSGGGHQSTMICRESSTVIRSRIAVTSAMKNDTRGRMSSGKSSTGTSFRAEKHCTNSDANSAAGPGFDTADVRLLSVMDLDYKVRIRVIISWKSTDCGVPVNVEPPTCSRSEIISILSSTISKSLSS